MIIITFRVPTVAGSIAGDFAEIVYEVIKINFEGDALMTIADVNQFLDEIALKYATNKSSNLHSIR